MIKSIASIESRRVFMLSIGQMAKVCQTSVQTLRLYDKQGLIRAAYIDPQSHYRYYNNDQIFQFNLVKYLQGTNLSLDEIKAIFSNSTLNLTEFWQEQEQVIKAEIKQEQRKLSLAKFQQHQLQMIDEMKRHLGKGPYIKQINKKVAVISTKEVVTPANQPDQEVAKLDQALLEAQQIPNLEYGFTFIAQKYQSVNDIHYQAIFKELTLPIGSNDLEVEDVSGTYYCINFMWSVEKYNQFLNHLLSTVKTVNSTVYEESWPLNYLTSDFTNGKNAIAELRIKI